MISTIVGRTGVLCSLRVPVRVRALLSYRLSILRKAFPRSVICVLSSFPLYSYFICAPNVMVIYVTLLFVLFYSNDPTFYSICLSTSPRFLSVFHCS